MIRLISGATRLHGRAYRPEDGAFSADKLIEERLVKAHVAEYVDTTSHKSAAKPAQTDKGAEDAPNLNAEPPKKGKK